MDFIKKVYKNKLFWLFLCVIIVFFVFLFVRIFSSIYPTTGQSPSVLRSDRSGTSQNNAVGHPTSPQTQVPTSSSVTSTAPTSTSSGVEPTANSSLSSPVRQALAFSSLQTLIDQKSYGNIVSFFPLDQHTDLVLSNTQTQHYTGDYTGDVVTLVDQKQVQILSTGNLTEIATINGNPYVQIGHQTFFVFSYGAYTPHEGVLPETGFVYQIQNGSAHLVYTTPGPFDYIRIEGDSFFVVYQRYTDGLDEYPTANKPYTAYAVEWNGHAFAPFSSTAVNPNHA